MLMLALVYATLLGPMAETNLRCLLEVETYGLFAKSVMSSSSLLGHTGQRMFHWSRQR